MVRKRLRRYPGMHIYHYAAYEKSTLLRLAGRYGVGENDVDDMLRNGILVDLYPLVRKSIRVGTENYSIKSLEPLYMGNELRTGEVTTATDSITQYARYCALRDEGRPEEAASVLKEIEDYNVYDCRSTRRLRDWLMARAIESGVPPRGPQPVSTRRRLHQSNIADDVERRLLKFAGDGVEERTPEQTAVAMVAAARGFHKREDKPFWWGHFDRVNNPVDEWADNSDVFIAERAEIVNDWHQPPKARKPQRHLRLIGELANGELSTEMYRAVRPARARGSVRRSGPTRIRFGDGPRVRQPRGAHRGHRRRETTQGRRRLRAGADRIDARAAHQHETAAGIHRRDCRGRRRRTTQPARRRGDGHPAAPQSPHDQRWTTSPHRT